MNRRDALKALLVALAPLPAQDARASVATLIGTGTAGYSDRQVSNPYGLVIGPDRALYFCDLDNQRVRRLDLETRRTSTIAGNGQTAYAGDGGPATDASLNMPHEIQFDAAGNLYIAERDNHVDPEGGRARRARSRRWRAPGVPVSLETAGPRSAHSYASRTASPWIHAATGCSFATSAITAFAKSILQPASSRRSAEPERDKPTPDGAPIGTARR